MHCPLAIFALAVMVEANPFPQAVTEAIAPPNPAPSGCIPAYVGNFAIVAQNISASAGVAKRQAADPACGQSTTRVMAPVRQYIDGQIQGAMHTETITYQVPCPTPVTQIGDGQIQNPVAPVSVDEQAKGPPPLPTITPPAVSKAPEVVSQPASVPSVAEAADAQPVVPSVAPAADTQPVVPSVAPAADTQPVVPSVAPAADTQPVVPSVAPAADTQPVVPTTSSSALPAPTSSSVPTSSIVRPPAPPSPVVSSTSTTTGDASASRPTLGTNGLESCAESGAFSMTLEDGILKDQQGRTGYIAANYQFQFDGPPQAGAIITAGFSICANGSLALGGSNVFYQCLSGTFYNLYDRYWAAQCSPVTIDTIKLKQC